MSVARVAAPTGPACSSPPLLAYRKFSISCRNGCTPWVRAHVCAQCGCVHMCVCLWMSVVVLGGRQRGSHPEEGGVRITDSSPYTFSHSLGSWKSSLPPKQNLELCVRHLPLS